jgi:hypothetical protein
VRGWGPVGSMLLLRLLRRTDRTPSTAGFISFGSILGHWVLHHGLGAFDELDTKKGQGWEERGNIIYSIIFICFSQTGSRVLGFLKEGRNITFCFSFSFPLFMNWRKELEVIRTTWI